MKAHFVTFLSPGTFVAEETIKPIESWDVEKATEMSLHITERYNATPYGFHFTTRERGPDDLDSKVTERSGTYYLGGTVRTLEEVEAENLPEERILRSNMRGNGWRRVFTTAKGWRWSQPLMDGDVVLAAPCTHIAAIASEGK